MVGVDLWMVRRVISLLPTKGREGGRRRSATRVLCGMRIVDAPRRSMSTAAGVDGPYAPVLAGSGVSRAGLRHGFLRHPFLFANILLS